MSLEAPLLNPALDPSPQHQMDTLVSQHYQPLFSIFSCFYDDPKVALQITERVFRRFSMDADMEAGDLYRTAFSVLEAGEATSPLLGMMNRQCLECWLLKELGQFRYAEIGTILGLDHGQVKRDIATARQALMPLV